MFDLTNGREQTITAGQTIRVYGLAEGDKYTVQELTRAGKMPAGFTLTKREQGGNALGGEGDSISGTIAKTECRRHVGRSQQAGVHKHLQRKVAGDAHQCVLGAEGAPGP